MAADVLLRGSLVFHGVNLKGFVVLALVSLSACGTAQTKVDRNTPSQGEALGRPVDSDESPAPGVGPSTIAADARSGATVSEAQVGAAQWPAVLAALGTDRVAGVFNHTSTSGGMHLADRLLGSGVKLVKVFAPEHGFRGMASDGEKVNNQIDDATGLPIISLYGTTKKPTAAMLADVDVIVFDIQDVGLRFFTYVSTMHYVMEAAAELGKRVVILDRPNPNGSLVDGPVLDLAYQSFIGMHEVPVSHGLTVGELARMINGEGWLSEGRKAELKVVPVAGYTVGQTYELPLKPSPNLPTQHSVYLYPTLCFFEGTVASIGRGTDFPFEVVGHPKYRPQGFSFTPQAKPGALYAPLKGEKCYGVDLRPGSTSVVRPQEQIDWQLLRDVAERVDVSPFINRNEHFDALAGSDRVRKWFVSKESVASFRESYQPEIAEYLELRRPYLLYPRR